MNSIVGPAEAAGAVCQVTNASPINAQLIQNAKTTERRLISSVQAVASMVKPAMTTTLPIRPSLRTHDSLRTAQGSATWRGSAAAASPDSRRAPARVPLPACARVAPRSTLREAYAHHRVRCSPAIVRSACAEKPIARAPVYGTTDSGAAVWGVGSVGGLWHGWDRCVGRSVALVSAARCIGPTCSGWPAVACAPGIYRSRCASQSVIIATTSVCIITGGGSFA